MILKIKGVKVLQSMNHAVKDISGLEFHFGYFTEDRLIGFRWVNFILFFHPDIHHVDSIFRIIIILCKFKGDYFMNVVIIDTAVFRVINRIKILIY